MKAIRKSDGKVIEVKEIYPMGDEYIPFVQYYETEDGTICQDTDLDFNVEETEEVTIDGWVARDKNGTLWICSEEPQRYSDWWIIDTDEEYTIFSPPSHGNPNLSKSQSPLNRRSNEKDNVLR